VLPIAPQIAEAPLPVTTSAIVSPAATSTVTATKTSGYSTLLADMEAKKGMNSPEINHRASDAFTSASAIGDTFTTTITPGLDLDALNKQIQTTPFLDFLSNENPAMPAATQFTQAMPRAKTQTETSLPRTSEKNERVANRTEIKIQNLNFNADEVHTVFDFVKVLMNAANQPLEAAI
jgi:hypothetical protein